MSAAVEAAKIEGASAERERIASVRATLMPGHEELIEALAFDGKSTAADAALAILGAEKQLRIGAAAALEEEAPPAVPASDSAMDSQARTMKRAEFDSLHQNDRRSYLKSGGQIKD